MKMICGWVASDKGKNKCVKLSQHTVPLRFLLVHAVYFLQARLTASDEILKELRISWLSACLCVYVWYREW